MEKYFRPIFLILIILGGCQQDATVPPVYSSLITSEEQKMAGDWRYHAIYVKNISDPFTLADRFLTPAWDPDNDKGKAKTAAGGERAILSRRGIFYSQEHTYQLRWNRSEYQLGTYGDPNWQPDFGTWQMKGDSLIHNSSMHYRIAYKISFSGNTMTRTSTRYMSDTYTSSLWKKGDIVEFKEVFVRP